MTYVTFQHEKEYRLPFYLAMEEYIARELPAQDYFFMWQVEPTVIFGRNQLVENEVDMDYCRANNIQFYRRKSGGGCVYADKSNIMLSYITPSTNVNFTFNRYMLMIEHALQKLGVEARTTGRNDILVGGKKVSGNAFYHLPQRSIVHGTLLYDTNLEHMVRATTPSDAKLKSKGVQSVRQHVTTLNNYISVSIEELKYSLRTTLCDGEIMLTAKDIEAIEAIESCYYNPSFIYGNRNKAFAGDGLVVKSRRIEGVGEFNVNMKFDGGTISDINIAGDFFVVGDLDSMLLSHLKGVACDAAALDSALGGCDCSAVIMNLKKEQLINLLTD